MTASRGIVRPQAETADLLDQAAELWRLNLSQSVIAGRIGISRSALGGMIARARRRGDERFKERALGNKSWARRRPPREAS